MLARGWREGFFNLGSGRVWELKTIIGSGRVQVQVSYGKKCGNINDNKSRQKCVNLVSSFSHVSVMRDEYSMLCSDDCWHVQGWQMVCGLKHYWPTWISYTVKGRSCNFLDIPDTRHVWWIWERTNCVRIGYCQKWSGIGYRVSVRHWCLHIQYAIL